MADVDRPGDVFLSDCPARLAVDIIAVKWAVVVLAGLGRGARRPGDLRDLIGGISNKSVNATLAHLRRHGLVDRLDHRVVPRHVEYSLTALGRTLLPVVGELTRWAEAHGDAVATALFDTDGDDLDGYVDETAGSRASGPA